MFMVITERKPCIPLMGLKSQLWDPSSHVSQVVLEARGYLCFRFVKTVLYFWWWLLLLLCYFRVLLVFEEMSIIQADLKHMILLPQPPESSVSHLKTSFFDKPKGTWGSRQALRSSLEVTIVLWNNPLQPFGMIHSKELFPTHGWACSIAFLSGLIWLTQVGLALGFHR